MQKLLLLTLALVAVPLYARADSEQAAQAAPQSFHDESEAGVVITGGNSSSQTFNFKQLNTYAWGLNTAKLNGKYLDTRANGTNTALYWTLGLRYERTLWDQLSVFAGQLVESDIFSGYQQRYSSDVGGKFFIYKLTDFYWDVEAGYRYQVENRFTGQVNQSYLRFYTEANRDWTKTFSTKADVEYLPNLSLWVDYQLNADFSVSAALNDVFAIKVGYGFKYRNLLIPPASANFDTQFTTALVAKL